MGLTDEDATLQASFDSDSPSLAEPVEPNNHLDVRYQPETMERVRDPGLTTLAALHSFS